MHSSRSSPGLAVALLLPRSLAPSLPRSLGRSLHRGPMHRHDATWCSDFAMPGMRRHYACAPCTLLGTAGSVMSLDDDLTIVCGDLTETCGPRSLPASHLFSPSRPSHLAVFSLSLPVAETPKSLMRSVRRHRSFVALPETPALPYLTRSRCSPTINLVRRIPRYARNSEHFSLILCFTCSLAPSFSFRLDTIGLMRAN